MTIFSNSLITLTNGAFDFITRLFSPVSIILILLVISLSWMALLEMDEMNRQGTKPDVGRH
jgi:hypothetical protein